LIPEAVSEIIKSGEARESVLYIRKLFEEFSSKLEHNLPYPAVFNADESLALLIFAFTRALKPKTVLECGVGYGVSSALVLQAMEKNNHGALKSIDLPSLADLPGFYTGAIVPEPRTRWTLKKGSSRQLLKSCLDESDYIDIFISDSANVYTIQKYELELVFPFLSPRGVVIFNNISLKFQKYLNTCSNVDVYTIWQTEKQSCATALLIKR
jgi:predicted O-methyltransferase YrrM